MKSKKKIFIPIVVILVIIAIVVGAVVGFKKAGKTDEGTVESSMTVDAQILAKQDLSESINVTGTVESQSILAVTTDIQSRIDTLNVKVGDRVEEGDELCTFDKTEIEAQIEALQNQSNESSDQDNQQVEAAQRELERVKRDMALATKEAKESYEAAKKECAKYKKAYDKAKKAYDASKKNDDLTEEEKANIKLKYDEAKANYKGVDGEESKEDAKKRLKKEWELAKNQESDAIEDAQIAVNNAADYQTDNSDVDSQLKELREQLEKTSIKAGQAGIITQLSIERGEITNNGTLMQIADDQNLQIKIPIREKDILKLEEGMKARITSDALPDKVVLGKVSQVINFATDSGGGEYYGGGEDDGGSNGGYSALVEVDPGSELLLGMSVKVEISLDSAGEKLAVPYDSIMEDDGTYVFRAVPGEGGNYTIERVDVEKGASNDYYTEVISNDLSEGDIIIIMPWMTQAGESIPVNIVDNADITVDNVGEMEEDLAEESEENLAEEDLAEEVDEY